MLVGDRGTVGVAGSAEVDGDNNDAGELSSARTTIAGVPQVFVSMEGTFQVMNSLYCSLDWRCQVKSTPKTKVSL